MRDIFVRAFKTFVQAFLATMISEFYILLECDAVHFFGQDAFITFAPVICAALAAGFSAVGNAFSLVLKPESSIDFVENIDYDSLINSKIEVLKSSDFRFFIYGLVPALLDAFPEDVEELPFESISLNNCSKSDVESTSCAE